MKSILAIATVALLASSSYGMNQYSQLRMMEFQRETLLYGRDLTGIATPRETLNKLGLAKGSLRGADNSTIGGNIINNGDGSGTSQIVTVANVKVDTSRPLAFFIGMAIGLQTDQSVAGSCVYSSVAILVMSDVYV